MRNGILWPADLDGQGKTEPLHLEELVAKLLGNELEDPLLLVDHRLVDAQHSALGHFLPLSGQEVLVDELTLIIFQWCMKGLSIQEIHLRLLDWILMVIKLVYLVACWDVNVLG
jgi:hypothetical protein